MPRNETLLKRGGGKKNSAMKIVFERLRDRAITPERI